jgi:hypothetical protein
MRTRSLIARWLGGTVLTWCHVVAGLCRCCGSTPAPWAGPSPPCLRGLVFEKRSDKIETMRLHRAPRVLASWIAVLAILMAALAPAISHALGAEDGAPWIEVCSSVGAKWVQLEDGSTNQAPGPGDGHAFEHCPYCSLHANAVAIPATLLVVAWVEPVSAFLPVAFLAAPRTLFAWTSAQPRAPPHFS